MAKYFALLTWLGAILLTHNCFIKNGTYQDYWWADVVMHGIGGMWVAGVILAVRPRLSFLSIFTLVLVVGGFWEYLEYVYDTPFLGVGEAHFDDAIWQLDTITDLVMDSVGALLLWSLVSGYNKAND